MAARDVEKNDHELHAGLLCNLAPMLDENDLKNLKQVLKTAGKITTEKMKNVTTFFELWNVLEQNGCVSVGKYDVLIEYLEMLHINICVIKIKEYIEKIEEYRARKHPRSLKESTDGLSESRTRQMVNDMVASAMQQFDERISKIEDRIDNTLKKEDDGSSGKLEDRISAQIAKVVKVEVEDKVNIVMKTAEDRFFTKLEDRMKTQTGITEYRVNVMMKTTADEQSAMIADIVNKELSKNLSAKAQPSTPVVVKAAATAQVNRKDKDGKTQLIRAAKEGDIVNVNSLLQSGADPDLKDEKNGYTALMCAVSYGQEKIVALLLENSADVNLQNNDGNTALMVALGKRGSEEIVALLLKNSADVNLQNKGGHTALMTAVSVFGRKESVALLLKNSADVNLQNKAESRNLVKVFDYVTKEKTGRDIGQKSNGQTALSMAEQYRLGDIVKMLKAAGAK